MPSASHARRRATPPAAAQAQAAPNSVDRTASASAANAEALAALSFAATDSLHTAKAAAMLKQRIHRATMLEGFLALYFVIMLSAQHVIIYRDQWAHYLNGNLFIVTVAVLCRHFLVRLLTYYTQVRRKKGRPENERPENSVGFVLTAVVLAGFIGAVWIPLTGRQRALMVLPVFGYIASHVYAARTRHRLNTERKAPPKAPMQFFDSDWPPPKAPFHLSQLLLNAATNASLACINPIIAQDSRFFVFFETLDCMLLYVVCFVNGVAMFWLIETLDPSSEWKISTSVWGRWVSLEQPGPHHSASPQATVKSWSRKNVPYTRPALVSYQGARAALASKLSYGEPVPSVLVDLLHGATPEASLHGVDNGALIVVGALAVVESAMIFTQNWAPHAVSVLCTHFVLYLLCTFKLERTAKAKKDPALHAPRRTAPEPH